MLFLYEAVTDEDSRKDRRIYQSPHRLTSCTISYLLRPNTNVQVKSWVLGIFIEALEAQLIASVLQVSNRAWTSQCTPTYSVNQFHKADQRDTIELYNLDCQDSASALESYNVGIRL